jgi:hypothetical protein
MKIKDVVVKQKPIITVLYQIPKPSGNNKEYNFLPWIYIELPES